MKFSLAVITVSLFRSASAAVPTSWTGSMTQNIYTPNCTDAALVSVDTTTSLVALGNSTLCETDVSGGIEFYSKIIVSCAHIEDSEHPVTMSAYLCTDSLCSNCSETASIDGWSSIEDLVNLTPDTCFSWKTISDDLNQTDAPLNEMFSDTSDSYWKYTSSSDVVAGFFEVFLGNTCIADYENHAEDSFPYTATEEGEEDGHGHPHGSEEEEDGHGHPHGSNVFAGTEAGGPSSSARVWGLSLSISAVAGLTGAILSV